MKLVKLRLRTGAEISGTTFDENDYITLKQIFKDWMNINKKLKTLGGRNLNVPDVFSEALFCYFFNAMRTNNSAYSYDCVTLDTLNGVQVKSASIMDDLTSFGPNSTWDDIYYVDFANSGIVDGKVYFYKIEHSFANLILNKSKNETFRDQQLQGRRPRFSIKREIIRAYNYTPILIINLLE